MGGETRGRSEGWRRVDRAGPHVDRFDGEQFAVGKFRCEAGATLWTRENQIGRWPLLVVPHRAVEILRPDAAPVVASPARCVLYNAHQPYARRLIDPRGDECTYFALDPEQLAEVVATQLGTTSVDPMRPFEIGSGPLTPRTFMNYRSLLRALDSPDADATALLEPTLHLVELLVIDALAEQGRRAPTQDSRTRARHRELAHEAERWLARHFAASLGLQEIADALGTSPYHLSRVFRRSVGVTVHEHRTRLRVNLATQRIADDDIGLTDLALELGFASHSHFSHQFRRHAGVTPSRWRDAGRARI